MSKRKSMRSRSMRSRSKSMRSRNKRLRRKQKTQRRWRMHGGVEVRPPPPVPLTQPMPATTGAASQAQVVGDQNAHNNMIHSLSGGRRSGSRRSGSRRSGSRRSGSRRSGSRRSGSRRSGSRRIKKQRGGDIALCPTSLLNGPSGYGYTPQTNCIGPLPSAQDPGAQQGLIIAAYTKAVGMTNGTYDKH